MESAADNLINTGASKKRMHMPHELYGKFSAKSDFIAYFENQVSELIIHSNILHVR
jgi:hypothetical protein